MSLAMITPVTAQTINNLNPDTGILLHDLDISSATDAASLMALITKPENQKYWFGATKGNINVQENREYWAPDFNGKRKPYKGEKHFSTANPKITGNLIEFTPENVKAISGAADIVTVEGKPNVTKVQPRASIDVDAYFSKVLFVTNNGPNGLYVVELDNATCTSGMNAQAADKDIGTMPFEFAAHSEDAAFTDDLPIRYWFYRKAEA